jgi:Rrf2 family transcriptional regulator, nitric oxide-sensitive transcriptional repressor
MFKINRKIEYALIALRHMSRKNQGQLTSAKEICQSYRAPFDPMSRVLQIMAQHGILKAEQGAQGGYMLLKDLSKVTLQELCEMISGKIQIADCFHGHYSHCDMTDHCNVISPMLSINNKIANLFNSISIKDLIESTKNPLEKEIRFQKTPVPARAQVEG